MNIIYNFKNALILLITIILFSSCENLFMEDDPANKPEENFEILWKFVDEKYSFFEYKNINWKQVYHKYRPMVGENTSEAELFDIMSDMLYELRDGHVNLFSDFDISRNWNFFTDRPQNFNYTVIERNYLKDDYKITGPLFNTILDTNIGYIYYSSFVNTISEDNIDYVLHRFSQMKGIIIDVRNNGGGNPYNAFLIASRIADTKRKVYRTYLKNGPGHEDFSEPNDVYIEPEGDIGFTKKVAILTNRSSYSATTFFAAMMKAFPNVVLIGDTTGGGGGMPAGGEMANGWSFRVSASRTFMPDGYNIEGGVPPHIQINTSPLDEANGIDSIIEKAIDELKQ